MRAIVVAVVLAACGHPREPKTAVAAGSAVPAIADARVPDAAPAPADAALADATPVRADASVAIADAAVRPPDDLVATVPVVHSCPKTYSAVARTGCALDDAWKLACKYPDGHCECVIEQPCAGWAGAYEEARKHPRAVWTCTPKVRADGCPGDVPKAGARCSKAGQQCMFGSCGGEVMVCRGGTWALDHEVGGPPVAPPQH